MGLHIFFLHQPWKFCSRSCLRSRNGSPCRVDPSTKSVPLTTPQMRAAHPIFHVKEGPLLGKSGRYLLRSPACGWILIVKCITFSCIVAPVYLLC